VAINSPVALTVDAGHDIRNVGGSNVFVLSTATSAIPAVAGESVVPRNQFRAQIPYLRARRNRRFELIVDEPSLARALPPRPAHPARSYDSLSRPCIPRGSAARIRERSLASSSGTNLPPLAVAQSRRGGLLHREGSRLKFSHS